MQTIVAMSTPDARSAVAVVRLSGDDAIAVAGRVFRAHSGRPLSAFRGYTAALGDLLADGEVLDEGVALVMRAPKSYTGEDVVELSCHGNPAVAHALVRACVAAGAVGAGHEHRRAADAHQLPAGVLGDVGADGGRSLRLRGFIRLGGGLVVRVPENGRGVGRQRAAGKRKHHAHYQQPRGERRYDSFHTAPPFLKKAQILSFIFLTKAGGKKFAIPLHNT